MQPAVRWTLERPSPSLKRCHRTVAGGMSVAEVLAQPHIKRVVHIGEPVPRVVVEPLRFLAPSQRYNERLNQPMFEEFFV
jgi:hypothetical protein